MIGMVADGFTPSAGFVRSQDLQRVRTDESDKQQDRDPRRLPHSTAPRLGDPTVMSAARNENAVSHMQKRTHLAAARFTIAFVSTPVSAP